jgi:hypothetical protein
MALGIYPRRGAANRKVIATHHHRGAGYGGARSSCRAADASGGLDARSIPPPPSPWEVEMALHILSARGPQVRRAGRAAALTPDPASARRRGPISHGGRRGSDGER